MPSQIDRSASLTELILLAYNASVIRKLILSRPTEGMPERIEGRICEHRNNKFLQLMQRLDGGAVKHENLTYETLRARILELIGLYKQINLITSLGDCELRTSKKGKISLIGADALRRAIENNSSVAEVAIETLDKEKKHILRGDESFLISLGISDKSGRVHDKRQGKFRQINRFLEHIELIYPSLPDKDELLIYDLCCGKSYLSFAIYYYLTEIKRRRVRLYGKDLKIDVISWCNALASSLGYNRMKFEQGDVRVTPEGEIPDMVVSLHACDVATDIVLNKAISLGCPVILSTPCCHRYLSGKIKDSSLSYVTGYPHLKNKLCDTLTDALRTMRLAAYGYDVTVCELTDPENTPKNTLIRAILRAGESEEKKAELKTLVKTLTGSDEDEFLIIKDK